MHDVRSQLLANTVNVAASIYSDVHHQTACFSCIFHSKQHAMDGWPAPHHLLIPRHQNTFSYAVSATIHADLQDRSELGSAVYQ
jgi:hypothetical protein